jgi:hypothetical protein
MLIEQANEVVGGKGEGFEVTKAGDARGTSVQSTFASHAD